MFMSEKVVFFYIYIVVVGNSLKNIFQNFTYLFLGYYPRHQSSFFILKNSVGTVAPVILTLYRPAFWRSKSWEKGGGR